jgi:hypothetical protein
MQLVISDSTPRSPQSVKACGKNFRMKSGDVDSNLSPILLNFSMPLIPFGPSFLYNEGLGRGFLRFLLRICRFMNNHSEWVIRRHAGLLECRRWVGTLPLLSARLNLVSGRNQLRNKFQRWATPLLKSVMVWCSYSWRNNQRWSPKHWRLNQSPVT